ncbi:unnamed protein product [Durusdinium trenchii]|uniref:PH domain-containing protein n=1 Tax=Durusdinium trenchii TaxID=1381693 RepID=A0ABP0NMI2_9DINO
MEEEVLLSGWLEKRLPVLRDTWEPHWCVLRQSSLACYEAERECSVPKLELRVLKWAAFREEDAFGDAQLHRKTRPCGFVLDLGTDVPHAHQRFVHFDAATEAQLQRWLEAFQALQLPASESPQASDATPSPKGYAISVRKRTFLYRKHTYKLRKNRPRNQVTATDDWCADISLQPEVKSPMPHVGRVMDFSKPMFGVSSVFDLADLSDSCQ